MNGLTSAHEERRPVLQAFGRVLRLEAHNLSRWPELMRQQVANRLLWSDGAMRQAVEDELGPRSRPGSTPWLRSRQPAPESSALVMTLAGHRGEVKGCAVSSDGSWIASASKDRMLKVWDRESGAERATLAGHTDGVNACAVSPDGKWIVSASEDHTLKVWNTATWSERLTLTGHTEAVTDCDVSPDGTCVVSSARDATVRVWDLDGGPARATLTDHSGPIYACSMTPDGTRFISASGKSIRVWDAASGSSSVAVDLSRKAGWVSDCALTPDGNRIVTVSHGFSDDYVTDNGVEVWDAATGGLVAYLINHEFPLSGVAVSPDGAFLVCAGQRRTLELWDLNAGERRASLRGHAGEVLACAFAPDGTWVVSGGLDQTVKVWEVASAADTPAATGHTRPVDACAMSPDGAFVVSASADRTLKVWDTASGRERATLRGHAQDVTACSVSPDGNWIVSVSGREENWDVLDEDPPEPRIRVWHAASGVERSAIDTGFQGWVYACPVSPDGALIVAGANQHPTLKVWVAATGAVRLARKAHDDGILGCSVSPDGTFIVSAGADGTLKIWDLPEGKLRATLIGHGERVTGCAVSPDGEWIVSASDDGSLRLWEATGGTEIGALAGAGGFAACAVSPDGHLIASVGGRSQESVEVWDVSVRSRLVSLPLPGSARCVVFHPWRPFVATGDLSGTVSMLDLIGVDYGPLVVTAVDRRSRMSVRCPKCFKTAALEYKWLGETINCPTASCGQDLQINRAVVPRTAEPAVRLRVVPLCTGLLRRFARR
jgi:WD40 repeat protein